MSSLKFTYMSCILFPFWNLLNKIFPKSKHLPWKVVMLVKLYYIQIQKLQKRGNNAYSWKFRTLKLRYCEKARKIWKIFHLDLTFTPSCQIYEGLIFFPIVVAFPQNLNFNRQIITVSKKKDEFLHFWDMPNCHS